MGIFLQICVVRNFLWRFVQVRAGFDICFFDDDDDMKARAVTKTKIVANADTCLLFLLYGFPGNSGLEQRLNRTQVVKISLSSTCENTQVVRGFQLMSSLHIRRDWISNA